MTMLIVAAVAGVALACAVFGSAEAAGRKVAIAMLTPSAPTFAAQRAAAKATARRYWDAP